MLRTRFDPFPKTPIIKKEPNYALYKWTFECDIAASDLCQPLHQNLLTLSFHCLRALLHFIEVLHPAKSTGHKKRVNNVEDIMSIHGFFESSVRHWLCSQAKTNLNPPLLSRQMPKGADRNLSQQRDCGRRDWSLVVLTWLKSFRDSLNCWTQPDTKTVRSS